MTLRIAACFLLTAAGWAQTVCRPTPKFSPCDLVFDLPGTDPAKTLDLHAEIRSPRHETVRANGFWDGGTRWVVRFTPDEAGPHTFRLTGPGDLMGKEGQLTATDNGKAGWLRAANLHHFALVDGNNLTPHLWMGTVVRNFNGTDLAAWKTLIDTRSAQHFNHVAITLVDEATAATFQSPEFFRTAEEKIRCANERGLIVDIAFFGPNNLMEHLLPTRADRQKWFGYALSRLVPFDVTWQGLEAWESYDNGRPLLKEIGGYLADLDPYKHTRSSRAATTSAPMAEDGWLRYRSYETADDNITVVEQQAFQYPAVNNFAHGVTDTDTFRHRLWNATANGHYPATEVPNEQAAAQMKVWFDFMSTTRYWELEPHFDVENGRALSLDEVEYIVYVEKPGPVTLTVDKHSYDVEWVNPLTGDRTKVKEKTKTEALTFSPPDNTHDWILHVSREGKKAGMLKSYKFDSRDPPLALQVMEGNPEKVPFDIVAPEGDTLQLGQPVRFAIKLKRQTKALQNVRYEWTGEVNVSERGYRVIGTGPEGTFTIPANIATDYPANLHIRLTAVNALGKVYFIDRNYQLKK
ncbi:MAG: hypothetical protein JWN34_2113 [Bryobacterales bacterium]|nr:hypothetical protein [Bryobacterales bacterium]